ncbi:MAG TPA: hypothetical protein VKA80_00240, partial [Beijerinckiaceae bacterium]|nr:hypothetical protein [Beijerinckiaceae bacterium]
ARHGGLAGAAVELGQRQDRRYPRRRPNNMEFERFAWADETDPAFRAKAELLSMPQGRFHMAGDQLTFWSGWQEGALISAFAAVKSIDRLTRG